MKTKKSNKTKLTREQDAYYGEEFSHYMNNVRQDTKRADRYAWKQTVLKWPKLKK